MNGFSIRKHVFRPRVSEGFLVFVLFLANLPAVGLWFFAWLTAIHEPDGILLKSLVVVNSLLWAFSAVVVFYDLKQRKLLKEYYLAWKRQSFLLAFILAAFFSIFWSIAPLISAYKVLILVTASLLGSFIGFRLHVTRWLDLLGWFGGILLFLSIAFALLLPEIGIMLFSPYDGAWRGIYWHKNHLGSLLALANAVFLIRVISGWRTNRLLAGADGALYLLSLLLVYLADSAAGILITLILNFLIATLVSWLKLYQRLKRIHYLGILGLFLIGVGLVAANLDFVFGLLNRTSSLTGRIPMWAYLFKNVIGPNPWFGYGFGAIWSMASFSDGMSRAVGWAYALAIGDNGFIDILLHVGVIGLGFFLWVFILAGVRSLRYALAQRTLIGYFPFVFMLFAFVANISFSLFLETESFVWLWMVAVLFIPVTPEQ